MKIKIFLKKQKIQPCGWNFWFLYWSGWRGSNPQQSAWKAGTLANWVTPASPSKWLSYINFLSFFKRYLIWAWLGSNQRPYGMARSGDLIKFDFLWFPNSNRSTDSIIQEPKPKSTHFSEWKNHNPELWLFNPDYSEKFLG